MESINFALDNNARVMSLSWGTETNSAFMEKAFEYASAKGMIIVAAAGNEPTGNPVYPAAYRSVIGVGALDPHGRTNWINSNYGSFVAFYAPGFANLPVGHNGEPGVYAGTSISAAYVANSISSFLSQNLSATKMFSNFSIQNINLFSSIPSCNNLCIVTAAISCKSESFSNYQDVRWTYGVKFYMAKL
jgi:hypothetical protein